MTVKALLLVLALSLLSQCLPPQNPIIGIYTEDAEDFGQQIDPNQTYISASYIKNIEMAGGQVIPLFYHYSTEKLLDILSKLNGVFLPGGEMPIDTDNQWTANIVTIFQYATMQNSIGNPFPIWATCLSYEAALYIYSGKKDNMTVLTKVIGQRGLTDPLIVKDSNSKLLKALSPQELKEATTGQGIFWFHHTWSITLETYQNTPGINKFWRLVSTSKT